MSFRTTVFETVASACSAIRASDERLANAVQTPGAVTSEPCRNIQRDSVRDIA